MQWDSKKRSVGQDCPRRYLYKVHTPCNLQKYLYKAGLECPNAAVSFYENKCIKCGIADKLELNFDS